MTKLTSPVTEAPSPPGYHALLRRAKHERKQRHLICSDIAAICGHDPYRTALHVYRDKIEEYRDEPITADDPRAIAGELKDGIARIYHRRTGRQATIPGFEMSFSDKHSFLAAAPDRLVIEDTDTLNGVHPLRVTTSRMGDGWGPDGSFRVPIHHMLRMQTQMLVLGVNVAEVIVLIGGCEVRLYRLHADKGLQDAIARIGEDFWQRCIVTKNPPIPSYRHPATADLLNEMCPPTDTTAIVLDSAEASDLARQYLEASRVATTAEADRAEAKMRLILLMGEHQRACLVDGTVLTRKIHTVKEHVVKERQQVSFRLNKPRCGADGTNGNGQEVA